MAPAKGGKGKSGADDETEDDGSKDAPAIADMSAAVTAIAELTTARRTARNGASRTGAHC